MISKTMSSLYLLENKRVGRGSVGGDDIRTAGLPQVMEKKRRLYMKNRETFQATMTQEAEKRGRNKAWEFMTPHVLDAYDWWD